MIQHGIRMVLAREDWPVLPDSFKRVYGSIFAIVRSSTDQEFLIRQTPPMLVPIISREGTSITANFLEAIPIPQ